MSSGQLLAKPTPGKSDIYISADYFLYGSVIVPIHFYIDFDLLFVRISYSAYTFLYRFRYRYCYRPVSASFLFSYDLKNLAAVTDFELNFITYFFVCAVN